MQYMTHAHIVVRTYKCKVIYKPKATLLQPNVCGNYATRVVARCRKAQLPNKGSSIVVNLRNNSNSKVIANYYTSVK